MAMTMRQFYREARERGVILADDPGDPTLPPGSGYLIDWFSQLGERRPMGVSGPLPIGWEQIGAWSALTGLKPTRSELDILLALDRAWLKAWRDAQPPPPKSPAPKPGRR